MFLNKFCKILFLIILASLLLPNLSSATTLQLYSGQSEDDGQEATGEGYVNTDYTYLEMVVAFGRWGAGIRFPNVTIPQGATINSVNISLDRFAGGDGHSHPRVTIACEDVDNATIIQSGWGSNGFNISNRWNNKTSATVDRKSVV